MTTSRCASSAPPRIGRWLLPNPPAGDTLRLFCLPHAGAGASSYRSWIAELAPAHVTVCPVQLPGRENRFGEPAATDLTTLVAATAEGLAGYATGPSALFGHSYGALLAYELARFWRRSGGPQPVHLFVSGRIAPHLHDLRPALHNRSDGDLLTALRRMGGIAPEVLDNAELMALQLPLLRADLTVNETYRHLVEPPLNCPISVFGGRDDDKVSPAELTAWSRHTSGRFTARMLPGGHFFTQTCAPQLRHHLLADLDDTLWETRRTS